MIRSIESIIAITSFDRLTPSYKMTAVKHNLASRVVFQYLVFGNTRTQMRTKKLELKTVTLHKLSKPLLCINYNAQKHKLI